MPEVRYRDNRSPEQRIADRLKPSCPDYAQSPQDRVAADASTTTHPTRTVTTIHYGGSVGQHGAVRKSGD